MYSDKLDKLLKKNGISAGDNVSVIKDGEALLGILMPHPDLEDKNTAVLKLSNGYNIGIRVDADVTISKTGARAKPPVFPKSTLRPKGKLNKVALLYTGGTIGSKIDYMTGGVHMLTKPEELMHEVPELADIANIDVVHVMSADSADMSYKEWQTIANAAVDALDRGASGVVITHGTDTMHYTSAALSFMLKDLNRPIVITGAQRSSDRGSSDAFMNLVCATHLASSSDVAEVGICMHATSSDNYCSFMHGTKVRKMHTSRRDAFKPINSRAIANVTPDGRIEYVDNYKRMEEGMPKTTAMTKFEPSVALIKVHPNSDPGILDYYREKGCKGIIIEGTGLGNVPVSTSEKRYSWLPEIKRAVDAGVILGITPQCLYGRVNPNVYRNLRLMSAAGAIFCEDMLPEVGYVKLGFLLANYSLEDARRLLNVNMIGEITKRIEVDLFGE